MSTQLKIQHTRRTASHIKCTISIHEICQYNHWQYHKYNVPHQYITYINTTIDSITYTMYLTYVNTITDSITYTMYHISTLHMSIQSLTVSRIQCTTSVHYICQYNHWQYHIYDVPHQYITYVNTIIDNITYTVYYKSTSYMSIQSLTVSHIQCSIKVHHICQHNHWQLVSHIQCTIIVHYIRQYNHWRYHIYNVL